MTLLIGEEYRILDADTAAQAVYGYSLEQLRSLTLQDLTAPGELVQLTTHESMHQRCDGSTFPVEMIPVSVPKTAPAEWLVILRDLTNQRRAREVDELITLTGGMVLQCQPAEQVLTYICMELARIFSCALVTIKTEAVESGQVSSCPSAAAVHAPPFVSELALALSSGDHRFGTLTLYGTREGTFSPQVLQALDNWARRLVPYLLAVERQEELRRQAMTDPLTGLPNRRAWDERLRSSVAGASKANHVSVLIFDLDGFKWVNDQMGHPAGDRLLIQIADQARRALGEHGFLARFGGDEFGVVLEACAGRDASAMGGRLLEALSEILFCHGALRFQPTASVGLVSLTQPTRPDDVIRWADMALYTAKRRGKNQVAVYQPEARGILHALGRIQAAHLETLHRVQGLPANGEPPAPACGVGN